jgi:hypothetical protein
MIISDLNVLEVVEAAEVVGGVIGVRGTRISGRDSTTNIVFNSTNNFQTIINPQPRATGNSAAAGADADAYNDVTLFGIPLPTYSYSKSDTNSYADYLGGSASRSTSVAVINGVL